jgi:hypothetical protein
MRHTLLIIGCALAAFADRFRLSGSDRGLAVNEAPTAPIPGTLPSDTPVVTIGIPTNLDPNKVLARKKALIAAGTEPLLAEKLAIDAEQQQYLRDNQLSVSATVEERQTTEKVLVLKTHPDGEPENVDLENLSIAKLTELAEVNSIDLKGARKHADIVAAILGSAKTAIIAICCALFFGATAPAASGNTGVPPVSSNGHIAREHLQATSPQDDQAASLSYVAMLSAAALPADRWTGVIDAVALAFVACAYCAKNRGGRYRREVASRFRRALFRIGIFFAHFANRSRGRSLATNVLFTPQQTSHGTVSLDGTAAIATKNYVVCRGADDRHFKVGTLVTDVPLGVLLNDEIATDEVDVVKKNIALFGLWPESLPAVAAAAILVDARLVIDLATPGRVKTLPTVPGIYIVIGRSRFAAAGAGDPVSIAHCTPYSVVVGVDTTAPTAWPVTNANGVIGALNSTAVNPTKSDFDALLLAMEALNDDLIALKAVLDAKGITTT